MTFNIFRYLRIYQKGDITLSRIKNFYEWVASEGLADFLPNMGQRAIPMNPPQQSSASQPQKISLSSLADKVQDMNWHSLYDVFARQFRGAPNDPAVGQLGQALYQAATNNDMSILRPFVQKHLQAQQI